MNKKKINSILESLKQICIQAKTYNKDEKDIEFANKILTKLLSDENYMTDGRHNADVVDTMIALMLLCNDSETVIVLALVIDGIINKRWSKDKLEHYYYNRNFKSYLKEWYDTGIIETYLIGTYN